jgi:hypothetical protein
MRFLTENCNKGFPSAVYSPHCIEFKEWVAAWRLVYSVAESYIGRRQLKQIDIAKTPSRHLKTWGERIHAKHNPDGYAAFLEEAKRRADTVSHFLLSLFLERLCKALFYCSLDDTTLL